MFRCCSANSTMTFTLVTATNESQSRGGSRVETVRIGAGYVLARHSRPHKRRKCAK